MENSSKGRITTLIAIAVAGCLVVFATHPQPGHGMSSQKGNSAKTHVGKTQHHTKIASVGRHSGQSSLSAPQIAQNNWLSGAVDYGSVHASDNDTTAANTCQAFKIVVNSW